MYRKMGIIGVHLRCITVKNWKQQIILQLYNGILFHLEEYLESKENAYNILVSGESKLQNIIYNGICLVSVWCFIFLVLYFFLFPYFSMMILYFFFPQHFIVKICKHKS